MSEVKKVSKKKPSGLGALVMAIATVLGAILLFIFPNLLSGGLKLLAWSFIGVGMTTSGILQYNKLQYEKLLREQELERLRRKRRQKREQEKREREKRLKRAQKKVAEQEAAREAKQEKIKEAIVTEAKTVWNERKKFATEQEHSIRQIIASTQNMEIRTLAGHVVTEWHEASSLAQWTAEQLIMFSKRPNVTRQARDDVREMMMKIAEIKANGNTVTEQLGEELKEKKEKAREEERIEEARSEAIKDLIENGDMKWRGMTSSLNRRKLELDMLLKQSNL